MLRPRIGSPRIWLFAAFASGFIAIIAAYFAVGEPIIIAAYRGEAPAALNRLITNVDGGPVEEYLAKGRVLLSRGLLVYVGICMAVAGWVYRKELRSGLTSFVTARESPITLAVFRIAFFTTLLLLVTVQDSTYFASLPKEFRDFPTHGGQLLGMMPFNPDVVGAMSALLKVACICGIVGLFSRTSAFIATVAGYYVLGIPQCFGKVNHYHHLVWIAGILSVSRCGDALSVDSVIRGGDRSLGRTLLSRRRATAYALPLRVIWLLMGVVYFFPGMWKLWNSGYEWGLSKNLSYHMYHKWASMEGWEPIYPIDQFPFVLSLGGLATILFELTFFLMLFVPRTRYVAAVGGLIFHNMTFMFMGISFWVLQLLYVGFIPWDRLFGRRTGHEGGGGSRVARRGVVPVCVVGGLLLTVNIVYGALGRIDSWPFACYPTFATIRGSDRTDLELRGVRGSAEEVPIVLGKVQSDLSASRLNALMQSAVLEDSPADRKVKARAFVQMLSDRLPNTFDRFRVYSVTRPVDPRMAHTTGAPHREELLIEVRATGGGSRVARR